MFVIITCKNSISIVVGIVAPIIYTKYCVGIICIRPIKAQAKYPIHNIGLAFNLSALLYSCKLNAAIIANNMSIRYTKY